MKATGISSTDSWPGDASDSGYPLDIGTFEKLNEKGRGLVTANMISEYARYNMDKDSPDAEWRTFRDHNPSGCRSIFTGVRSVPLKCCWMELESCELIDIVDQTAGEDKVVVEIEENVG